MLRWKNGHFTSLLKFFNCEYGKSDETMYLLLNGKSNSKFEMYSHFLQECLDLGALNNLCFAALNRFLAPAKAL